jgi:hypothetical protein
MGELKINSFSLPAIVIEFRQGEFSGRKGHESVQGCSVETVWFVWIDNLLLERG